MLLVSRLDLPEGKAEIGLVDMHFSNRWHNAAEELMFQKIDEEKRNEAGRECR